MSEAEADEVKGDLAPETVVEDSALAEKASETKPNQKSITTTKEGPLLRAFHHLKRAEKIFSESGGRYLSASIAFYALLSIAPILFFALKLAATLAPEASAREVTEEVLAKWLGSDPAHAVLAMLDNLEAQPISGFADVLQIVLLLYASTRLFSALRRSIHEVWGLPLPSGEGFRASLKNEFQKRIMALVMVVVIAALIVFLLVLKALMAQVAPVFSDLTGVAVWILALVETFVTVGLFGFLVFAVMMLLPSARVHWRDAVTGASITAVFASIGSSLIGLYLSHSSKMSMFGAASSFVFLLLWVSYSAQLLLFGIALTKVRAEAKGRPIRMRE